LCDFSLAKSGNKGYARGRVKKLNMIGLSSWQGNLPVGNAGSLQGRNKSVVKYGSGGGGRS
ncbi:MAG: hypothetical protein RSB48_03410, partial [Akkermansia sp.]